MKNSPNTTSVKKHVKNIVTTKLAAQYLREINLSRVSFKALSLPSFTEAHNTWRTGLMPSVWHIFRRKTCFCFFFFFYIYIYFQKNIFSRELMLYLCWKKKKKGNFKSEVLNYLLDILRILFYTEKELVECSEW